MFVYRYMNGAATNPDAHVVAYAAAQVKKGLEIAKKLGAENFGEIIMIIVMNSHDWIERVGIIC